MDARVPAVTLDDAREALHRVFGFSDFRPGQAEILEAILGGQNVLAVMPTGSGKSLLFQLPALLHTGLTVVVSPLIALMRDQVAQMRSYGIEAAALNSVADAGERRTIFDGLDSGKLRLLYVAPERLLATTRCRCSTNAKSTSSPSTRRIASRKGPRLPPRIYSG